MKSRKTALRFALFQAIVAPFVAPGGHREVGHEQDPGSGARKQGLIFRRYDRPKPNRTAVGAAPGRLTCLFATPFTRTVDMHAQNTQLRRRSDSFP
jgi:hypothetical protein